MLGGSFSTFYVFHIAAEMQSPCESDLTTFTTKAELLFDNGT